MKLPKFNRLFRPSTNSNRSRSDLSYGSASASASSSSNDGSFSKHKPSHQAATPTSVLQEVSGDWSELVQAFKLIDRDNDGVVSRTELEALLSRLGPDPPSREEVRSMLSEVDRDGDGCISLEELASRVVAGTEALAAGLTEPELREAFGFFDADHDGRITAEELLRVFTAIGDERCTLDDCRRMIGSVNKNGDGFVCFEDFSRMMELQRC